MDSPAKKKKHHHYSNSPSEESADKVGKCTQILSCVALGSTFFSHSFFLKLFVLFKTVTKVNMITLGCIGELIDLDRHFVYRKIVKSLLFWSLFLTSQFVYNKFFYLCFGYFFVKKRLLRFSLILSFVVFLQA